MAVKNEIFPSRMELSGAQRALLDDRVQRARQAASKAERTSIPRRPASDDIPLSFAQERLWFLHQLFPNSAEYNVPVVVRLRGRLDERSLQCALAAVVERHEILRSHVAVFEGRPALVADAPGPVSVAFHDLPDDAAVAEVLAAAGRALRNGSPAWGSCRAAAS